MMQPCPWCGIAGGSPGYPYLEAELVGLDLAHGYGRGDRARAVVRCHNCGATGPVGKGGTGMSGADEAKGAARAAWNDRRGLRT